MRTSVLVLFTIYALAIVVNANVDLNQIFTISVVGSFRQDIPGFLCPDCDCTAQDQNTDGNGPCSIWVDNVDCGGGPDDNQQRWGKATQTTGCACFCQSGVGFQGITDVQIQANSANDTRLGRMRHYNNAIEPPSPTQLQLFINMSAPQLVESFETIFPLSFVETPNTGSVSGCDTSIQLSTVPCDDRFSFDAYSITKSFLSKNVRYTLVITGFIQQGGTKPIANFDTQENTETSANVYAKIVTFCEAVDCPVNYLFEAAPVCACVCVLTNKTCNTVFSPIIAVNEQNCDCECAADSQSLGCNASNPDIGAFNPDSCSCGCNVTNAYCATINPLYEASLLPNTCACACNRQAFIDCRTQNLFLFPVGSDCHCECGVTDELCNEVFGSKYRANKGKCGCYVPGSSTGLTNAEIAGIVIASVLGPLLIIAFIAILAAILAYLILAGYIPGIYGYKIAQGSFAAGGNSGLYADPWTNNSNAAAG